MKALAADIQANGLLQPIVRTKDGKIVDGKNRLKACDMAGVKPLFRDWTTKLTDAVAIDNELYQFVLSMALSRRHLDESQRAMAAAKLAGEREKAQGRAPKEEISEPKEGELPIPETTKKSAIQEAAATLNVSERSTQFATKVIEEGSKELQNAVNAGEVAVSDAASVADLPADKQKAALAKVRSGKSRTLKAAAGRKPKASKAKVVKPNKKLDYDDAVIDGYYGHLFREIDTRGKELKCKGTDEHKAVVKVMHELADALKALKKLRK